MNLMFNLQVLIIVYLSPYALQNLEEVEKKAVTRSYKYWDGNIAVTKQIQFQPKLFLQQAFKQPRKEQGNLISVKHFKSPILQSLHEENLPTNRKLES